MSNYVPRYTKKKQTLARREEALRRLIASDAPKAKLLAAAAEVRDARVRHLRARRATIVPTDDAQDDYDRLDERIQILEDTTIDLILVEFGCVV